MRILRSLALGFTSVLALSGAAHAGDITYPGLNTATTVQDTDLIATWRASGPLTKVQASVLNAYIQGKLNPVYLQIGNSLSELSSTAATARTNLGLGSAATQSTGTSGMALCLMNANCTWSGTETFNAAVTLNGGVTVNGNESVTGTLTAGGLTVNGGPISGVSGRLIGVQVFTASGTYTPDAGTNSVIVDCQGAGGASGGIPATGAGQNGISGSGSAGAWAVARYTSGFAGATVTIGAGGVGASGSNGGAGGTTSFGAMLTCPGGVGASAGIVSSTFPAGVSSANGSSAPTGSGIITSSGAMQQKNASFMFSSGVQLLALADPSEFGGYAFGFGGAGKLIFPSSGAVAGNNGGGGLIIVYEYS